MQRSWGRSDSALPPPAAALACCLLLCLGQAACTVVLPFGAVLDDLPGAAAAQAASGAGWPSNVSISLVDETVQVSSHPGIRLRVPAAWRRINPLAGPSARLPPQGAAAASAALLALLTIAARPSAACTD